MLVTPATAKGKCCIQTMKPPCVAAKCMAWIWWDEPDAKPRRGYCGLAGQPYRQAPDD